MSSLSCSCLVDVDVCFKTCKAILYILYELSPPLFFLSNRKYSRTNFEITFNLITVHYNQLKPIHTPQINTQHRNHRKHAYCSTSMWNSSHGMSTLLYPVAHIGLPWLIKHGMLLVDGQSGEMDKRNIRGVDLDAAIIWYGI